MANLDDLACKVATGDASRIREAKSCRTTSLSTRRLRREEQLRPLTLPINWVETNRRNLDEDLVLVGHLRTDFFHNELATLFNGVH